MQTKYNTYKLKEADTLISIAKELKKTPQEVASFHNIFASEDKLIGVSFPKKLQELYVPLAIDVKEIEHIPKVKFDYNSVLNIKLSKQALVYKVEKQIITKLDSFSVKFQIEVKFIKKVESNFLFEIHKSHREKDTSLDTILYNIIEELEEVFYPLQLIISNEGAMIAIKNHKEILKNWSDLKPIVQEKYQGEVIDNYLSFYEKGISDKAVLESLLFKDIFLKTYFNSLYGNYTSTYAIEKQYSFPILSKCKNINFFVKQTIDPYLSEKGKVAIEISGELNDKRTHLDFESNLDESFFTVSESNKVVDGNIDIKYTLNAESHVIEKAFLECDLQLENYRKIKLAINLIES